MRKDDIIKAEYLCPRCGHVLMEKKPTDKRVQVRKEGRVRLFCTCGYYRDINVDPDEFHRPDE